MPAILERVRPATPLTLSQRSAGITRPPSLDSQRLLQGCNEILIRHGGETYRLRHTRNDKLILTK